MVVLPVAVGWERPTGSGALVRAAGLVMLLLLLLLCLVAGTGRAEA